jgi:Phage integrase family
MESSEPDLDLIERALVQEAESERERATAPPLGLARLAITPHSLRHTYCSLLIAQGEDLATVADHMRHADHSTTLKVYTHVMKHRRRASPDASTGPCSANLRRILVPSWYPIRSNQGCRRTGHRPSSALQS